MSCGGEIIGDVRFGRRSAAEKEFIAADLEAAVEDGLAGDKDGVARRAFTRGDGVALAGNFRSLPHDDLLRLPGRNPRVSIGKLPERLYREL